MRTAGLAYGCGTARHRYRLLSPPRAFNKFPVLTSLLCDGVDGGHCLAGWRLHCSRSCSARRLWTSRRRWIRLLWLSNQSLRPSLRTRSSPLRPSTSPTSGRAHGHRVESGADTVRTGCTIASPRDRARTGDTAGVPHINANREKSTRISCQKLTRHPRSAHAAGPGG
jgi:hypothetical protein